MEQFVYELGNGFCSRESSGHLPHCSLGAEVVKVGKNW